MIKVVIADDHYLIREGFKKIFDNEIDISVVGEASSVQDAISLLKIERPDILVLDINLPDKNGLDAIAEIISVFPEIKILISTIHPEDMFALRALKLGALGYLTKESPPEEYIRAIRKVATGRKYISETLGEQLAVNYTGTSSEKKPHESLSDREFQVLCLIGHGKTITEISNELFLSISTVNTYRNRILEKLSLRSNAALIRYCLQNKLGE